MVAWLILSESPGEALSKFTVPLGYVCDLCLFEHGLNWVSITCSESWLIKSHLLPCPLSTIIKDVDILCMPRLGVCTGALE